MKIKTAGEEIKIYDFNVLEAFKIARKLEREGISFYKKLAGDAKDPRVKEVLLYLLDEEEEHLQFFEKMVEGEDPDGLDDSGEDVTDIVESGVFALPDNKDLTADMDKALELGITIERRSLAFYLELLKHTESDEGKNALKKVIGEEEKHWEELKRLIK
jgi:rubrerythrin